MEILWQDLNYGFRMLFKNPRFTAVAVLSLAIGIGATSAIFSVANALLFRPLTYKESDRLGDPLESLTRIERGAGLVFSGPVPGHSR